MKKSEMVDYLKRFFCISQVKVDQEKSPLVSYIISELDKIQQILSECTQGIRLYGSSILIAFCVDSLKRATQNQDPSQLQAKCKMVDF